LQALAARGHGRITTRTIQVLPGPDDLPFPHVSQVFLIGLAGRIDVTEATRWAGRSMDRPFTILGLTP